MSGSKKNHNTMIFFFFERKKVKPGSIKDTDLTPGWEVQSTTSPLPGFHTDVSAAVVSSRRIKPGMCLHPRPVHYHWTTRSAHYDIFLEQELPITLLF